MANSTKGKQGSTYPQTQWVACELTKAQKDKLKAQKPDTDALFKALEGLISQGYRFTTSWDMRADCVGCYLTAPKERDSEPAKCLSARAPDLFSAVMVLCFKHFTLLNEDWSGSVKANGIIDPWG